MMGHQKKWLEKFCKEIYNFFNQQVWSKAKKVDLRPQANFSKDVLVNVSMLPGFYVTLGIITHVEQNASEASV